MSYNRGHITNFLVLSLLRYLARKGVVDLNDFVEQSLKFLHEAPFQAMVGANERKELEEYVLSMPRHADDPPKFQD